MFAVQEHLASVYLLLQQHSPCPHYTQVGHTVQDQCDAGLGVGTDDVFLHWASKLRCHQSCGPPSSCERTAVPPATDTTRSFSKVAVLDLNTGHDAVSVEEKSLIFQSTGKVKVKFTLEQATKSHRRSRCIALLFLQLKC
jgi:hypothetical protein